MRWDDLFADLAAQWEAQARRELDGEVADRTRRERALVRLSDRLVAAVGCRLGLVLVAAGAIAGRVLEVGDGWVLVADEAGGPALVPLAAITGVTGLPSGVDGAGASRRFDLGHALRGVSRDRSAVLVTVLDGTVLSGTIDAVGRDALELSEHPADLPRRAGNVTGRRLVPFAAVVLLRPGRGAGAQGAQSWP
ncbi:hypothetical protein SAMN04489867_1865 [Pedococcus dokdonensis]|uniref:Uncharacterized protein n=1 Tax=Pedococcus dokdonensis TaxID=443156 RepID=A0A1H0R715_9MICO|nr:hypothetical protein [Pedococcus dokdonensis]SDP25274.1 hypothetical protein SAMN04489867_1865 [Pedococcus dokdonensis]